MKTRKSNNPNGRPLKEGPTEMVSKRIPSVLMEALREKNVNVTQFIIDAIKEKLERQAS